LSILGKFKVGDKVLTPYGGETTVTRVFFCRDTKRMRVHTISDFYKFDQKWDEKDLRFNHTDLKQVKTVEESELGDKCPKCSTEWTISKFGAKIWYDCSKCKKTAEKILEVDERF